MIDIHCPRHIAITVVLPLVLVIGSSAQFETRSSTPIIYEPQSVAVADFNHDGKVDVAAAALYTGQVAILLGNGNGTFQPALYYTIDSELESVCWIAAADFQGNGNLDLAVADLLGSNISILLGNGDGTFQPPVQYLTTQQPSLVAVGDFNHDGKPDLILADWPYVSVMLGNGDGTFQSPIDTSIFSPLPVGIPLALGDFNHDGNLDMAIVKGGTLGLGILLGNGDGTFREGAQYAAGEFATSITVGDFTGDHKLGLAVTNGSIGNQIYILLGNGDGTFQSQPPVFANEPAAITTADVNGDGRLDLLFITLPLPSPLDQFTVMLGNGDGTFQAPVSYGFFDWAKNIAVADFNGDHKPDVVVADYLGSAVDVLLNTGVVNFSPTTPLSFTPQLLGTSSAPQSVTLRNTGAMALSIASISTKPPFHLSTTCQSSVPPGGTCTLSVTFEPSVIGFKSGVVSLNDSASSKPQAIELNGIGTVISYSPTKLSFGSLKVGTKSAPQVVTVTNTGSTTVTVTKIKIADVIPPDYFQTNNCGSQIAPGASCTINVTFKPTRTGPRTATLEIFDSGGASPQQISLTGTGT